jgi:hypothetical protein
MTSSQKVERFTKRLVATISAVTPVFLIFCIIVLGFFNSALEIIHYKKIVGNLAWIGGFVFGGLRFAAGLGGVKMIMANSYVRGSIFIAVSILSTFWIAKHTESIAESIALVDQFENAIVFVQTTIWTGLVGELLLAVYMFNKPIKIK